MNSMPSPATGSAATPCAPSSDATCASSARACVATRLFVHERVHRFIHSPALTSSTVHPQISPRAAVGKSPAGRRLARARAIEGIVTEFRADRVERGVQARDPGAGEEVELLAAADPADRDADEAHRADPAGIAGRGPRVPEQRAARLDDPQAIAPRLGQGPPARARL